MALPPAVKTVRVTFGSGATQVTGAEVSTEVSFTPTAAVIWAATGVPLLNPTEVVTSQPGEEAFADIVNPNQPGFIDGNGNTIRDYGVRVSLRYLVNRVQVGAILTKLVKFAEDDDTVDLDLMIPITSASGTVVYIPDSWSADVLAAQTASLNALAAAERAEAAAADVDLSGLEPAGLSDETKESLSNTIAVEVGAVAAPAFAEATVITYDAEGNVETVTTNGITTTYTYDTDGNVATDSRTVGETTTTRTYAYDTAGNLTGIEAA
jgi:YD repeat-containing protein